MFLIGTWLLRSEGPAVSSPVREGGEPLDSTQRPEGPAQIVAHLFRARVNKSHLYPAPTDGATTCRSFGPKHAALGTEPARVVSRWYNTHILRKMRFRCFARSN